MRLLSACGSALVASLLVAACSGKAFENAQTGLHDAGAGSSSSGGSSSSSGGGGNSKGGASATGGSRATGGSTGNDTGGAMAQGGMGGTIAGGGTGGTVMGGGTGGNNGGGGMGGTIGGAGGSVSGGATTADSGPPASCNSASDCPDPGTVCQTAACLGHECGYIAVPTATPPNKSGDCRKTICTQNGTELVLDDPSDSDDGNPCSADSCQAGVPLHAPLAGGQCPNGYCDQSGRCVGCVVDSQCPSGSTECTKMRCVQGACQRPPPGTLCNGFADQCDDKGNCVDCWNSGGCDECCVCSNGVCIPA